MSNSVLYEEDGGTLVVEDGATVLETDVPETLVIEADPDCLLVDNNPPCELVADVASATVLEILHVLPTETIPEEEEMYAKRVDFVDDTLIYRGEATPGTLESQAGWRVRRLTLASDDDVTEEWADGNANFINVWDNRATLTYS